MIRNGKEYPNLSLSGQGVSVKSNFLKRTQQKNLKKMVQAVGGSQSSVMNSKVITQASDSGGTAVRIRHMPALNTSATDARSRIHEMQVLSRPSTQQNQRRDSI